MKRNPTVAIYSGVNVSTTFVERLIKGLVGANTTVYIFGAVSGKPIKHKNLHYFVYGTRWHKLLILIRYTILLFIFKPKEKQALDLIIKAKHTNKLLWQVKYYPVLYHQPDIFHVQWAKGLDDWIWVQDFGMKLVVSLRGAHINYSPIADQELATLYRKIFPKVDAFHAVSEAIAIEASKYGADKKIIQVVKSGMNLDTFSFKLKAFDTKGPLKILSIGRDHWKKNYRFALDAMYLLKQKGALFHYNIIGVSENEMLLFQRAQLELVNDVNFIEAMPFKGVKEAIKQADVLLLPSVEEGIANVVLEAMALGTLVVSTDCGGMAEVVIPNQTGYLVPVRDIQAMAMALVKVSKLSIEDYQTMAKQARDFVEQHHTEERMIGGIQALYENLTSVDV